MSEKYDLKTEQDVSVLMSPLEIKQSMISPFQSKGSGTANATEVQVCLRSQNVSNEDATHAAKDTGKTTGAVASIQNISEANPKDSGRNEKISPVLQNAHKAEIQTDFEQVKSPKDKRFKASGDTSSIASVQATNGNVTKSYITQKDSSTQTDTSRTVPANVAPEHSYKILTPVAVPPKPAKGKTTPCITQEDTSTQTDAVITISAGKALDKDAGNSLSPAVPTSTSSESSTVCDGSVQCMLIGESLPLLQHHPLDAEKEEVQKSMCEKESSSASTLAKDAFCDSTMSSQEEVYDSCHSTQG